MTDTTTVDNTGGERVSTAADTLSTDADKKGPIPNPTPGDTSTVDNTAQPPGTEVEDDTNSSRTRKDADVETETTTEETEAEAETFPRAYVEELRTENGRYRQRAQQADAYAQRLHTELVRATGRLADPTDLPFVEDHLVDADKMVAAIDELLAQKPHLAARRPSGDIGLGQGRAPSANVDLAAILRGSA